MRSTLGWIAAALLLFIAPNLYGASPERVLFIDVPHFDDDDLTIRVDGQLDEGIWSELQAHDGMRVISPDTLAATAHPTQVVYFHTERGLYVGAKLEQPPETLVARLSGRDQFINRDSFGVTLDTSGEGLYGYWFTVNLGGAVMDGKVAPERRYSNEWDGPWLHGTAELADGWSVEIFLPWSMMAMPQTDGPRRMGFYTNRKVTYLGERWAVPPLPFTSARFMSTLGQLNLSDVRPRRQLDFYPYLSATHNEIKGEDRYRAGLDLFWRPTSNFQVAATANPDFGAVESDDVVVNLTAFETFFPEKRLFFLEGNEVFITTPRSRVRSGGRGGFGLRTLTTYTPTPTTLLNTRRIGGPPGIEVPDGTNAQGAELGRPTDLLGAVKVTGQASNWRYGLLTAFEDDVRRVAERDDGTFRIRDRWTGELALGTDTGQPLSLSILAGVRHESLGGRTYRVAAGVTFKPNDRFSLEFDTEYYRRDGWLLHQEDRRMTTFAATEWRPRFAVDLFLSARQQLRLTLQWAGAQADEQDFWLIPERPGSLIPMAKQPGEASDDFTLSRMVGQLRYRCEIDPLSDLFVVYTRGSNLDGRIDSRLGADDANGTRADGFADLFQDAFNKPVVEEMAERRPAQTSGSMFFEVSLSGMVAYDA